ncbi:VAMP-associated protein [Violaceomyces palustris]|uniref:VAMP-associated protein n=1 Tax=Violaceomyces palustris TaxID=1673888 RepID=A0ACD0P0H1_9BASI|nr:VAMP-associated protein [Violaceomyces palustris]
MSVDLNPHVQLGFPRPLTQLVKRTLQVSNPNNQPVAFKVKTTAPKQYCVRPNSGRIEPGEKVEVQVLLQPMKEEPPLSAKCRDKFLVQSTIITPERETTSLVDLWGIMEKEDKSAIHEQKIRCAFLPAATATVPEEGEGYDVSSSAIGDEKFATVRGMPSRGLNGASPANDDGSFSSPQQAQSPNGAQSYNPVLAASNAASNTDGSAAEKARVAALAAGGATKDAGSRAVNGASSARPFNASTASTEELQAEIRRLRDELALAKKNGGSANTMQASTAEGVPVHIVAAIAFGVFAFTYLLF